MLLTVCIFIALLSIANASEMYECLDRGGKPILTTSPQDGMTKCVVKDSYRDPTPQEREDLAKQKAAAVSVTTGPKRSSSQSSSQSSPTLTDSQKKQRELWAEHNKASKEYHKAKYEGSRTPAHKDPKRKAMFDTMKKAIDYQLSQ